MKLLLVDDDSLALEGLTTDLRLLGHPFDAIYTANGKASAVEILKREDVDMIFCDLEMPGGNGLELLAWVREHRPDIILVILSCHDEFYYAQRAVQLSCFDYILKPATPDVIGPVVLRAEELLDGRRRDQRIRKIGAAYVDRVAGDTEKAVDAADSGAAHLGKGGQEGELPGAAGPQQRRQLRAHVAPQGGIGLFIYVRDPGGNGAGGQRPDDLIGPLRGQVARLGVHHQHLRVGREGGGHADDHQGPGAMRGKLDAAVQCAGEIIRNDH